MDAEMGFTGDWKGIKIIHIYTWGIRFKFHGLLAWRVVRVQICG